MVGEHAVNNYSFPEIATLRFRGDAADVTALVIGLYCVVSQSDGLPHR
jgi:hypothetical protein